jgi:hypothetical protein
LISFSFTDQELFSSICIQLIESSELFSSTWARFLLWETFSVFLCLCFCFDDVFVYTFSLFVFLLCLRFCWGDKWCHPLAWNGHRLRTFTQRCLGKVSLARKIVKNRKQKVYFLRFPRYTYSNFYSKLWKQFQRDSGAKFSILNFMVQ